MTINPDKYYVSILRLVTAEDIQNPDNLLDPFYQEFEIGSYKSMMGIRIKHVLEAAAFCKQMTKYNNATYIYQIRELEEDNE